MVTVSICYEVILLSKYIKSFSKVKKGKNV